MMKLKRILSNTKRVSHLYAGIKRRSNQIRWQIGKRVSGSVSHESSESARKMLLDYHPSPENTWTCQALKERRDKKVSVIMPVYNAQDYLEDCLSDLLREMKGLNAELLIIDDGSVDATPSILEKYTKLENVRVIRTVNGGPARARNTGIRESCGEYLMFVDADDRLRKGMLRRLLKMTQQDSVDIACCNYTVFSEMAESKDQKYPDAVLSDFGEKCAINGFPWGKLFHYHLFEKVGFPENFLFEDTMVHWMLFRMSRKMAVTDYPGYRYRINFQGVSYQAGRTKRVSLDTIWVLEEMLRQRQALSVPFLASDTEEFLRHTTVYSYFRIKGMEKEIKEAFFIYSIYLMEQYRLPAITEGSYRELYAIYRKRDYGLWELYCKTH
ncbi:MAG: glycosyltransferase family 2 protein [Blautia sp.]|nr:glycosyltransferase family 2 protein [Blautia sp.]